jgi:hypothetical protein
MAMVDDVDNNSTIAILHGNKPRDLFPGYYRPTKEERRNAYRSGLVSLDANALLDLYRFNPHARSEFFEVLERLRPRLFVTHQAALEFHRRRLSVVEDRLSAAEAKCKEIEQPLRSITDKINEFANRHQIDAAERQRLTGLVQGLASTLADSIRTAGAYDLTIEQARDTSDPVLERLELLLAERIGDAPSESQSKQLVKEAARRADENIPPGYADNKKIVPELRAGDYVMWWQLIDEARKHNRPVLFVTNEQKEDWVLKGTANQILGPRPELVLEMQRDAGVAFHMASVVGLLTEAREYLGTTVSPSTIREAEAKDRDVDFVFTSESARQYNQLSGGEQDQFRRALLPAYQALMNGRVLDDWPDDSIDRLKEGLYLLRWSSDGRATLRLNYDPADEYDATVTVLKLTRKSSTAESVNGR